jgi:hypothetical protein
MTLSKIAVALTAAVIAAATMLPAAAAAATGVPAFAFDECPAIPVDVDRSTWRCEEMHATGSVRLGNVDLPVALKTTHAEGRRPGATKTEFIFGALRSDPVRVPGGLLGVRTGSPLTAANLQLQYAGHIDFVAGPPMAEILHLKFRVGSRLVGDNCYVGTDNDPLVIVGAIVGERVPVQDDPQVLKFTVEDNAFAVPTAHGCGPFGVLVDRRFGLPSTGTLRLTVYFSIKTYDKI